MEESREHHYVFAHRMMPHFFYDNPLAFIGLMSENGNEFIQEMWKDVGDQCEEMEGERLSSAGLSVKPFKSGKRAGVLITLPPPIGMTECYFVVALATIKKSLFGKLKAKAPMLYTLELGMCEDESPRTVLCSWSADGTHANFGDGCEPEPEAFIKQCLAMA